MLLHSTNEEDDWIRLTKCHEVMGFREKSLVAQPSETSGFVSESPMCLYKMMALEFKSSTYKKCVQFANFCI